MGDGKCLGRPVAESIELVPSSLERPQELDSADDGARDGTFPVFMIGADQGCAMRKLARELSDTNRKPASFVLLQIPGSKVDFGKELLHLFRFLKVASV